MRPLWSIEKGVLDITLAQYRDSSVIFRQQIHSARVTAFENNGSGFLSTITVDPVVDRLPQWSPLVGCVGTIDGIAHHMDFVVFLSDGVIAQIEGYPMGGGSTANVDFEHAMFKLKTWDTAAWKLRERHSVRAEPTPPERIFLTVANARAENEKSLALELRMKRPRPKWLAFKRMLAAGLSPLDGAELVEFVVDHSSGRAKFRYVRASTGETVVEMQT